MRSTKRGSPDWAVNTLPHLQIIGWFKAANIDKRFHPTPDQAYELADRLKTYLHRANNAEAKRTGKRPPGGFKDLVPGKVLHEKTDAILSAVAEYEKFCGDIIRTPKGDVFIDSLRQMLRQVRSMHGGPAILGQRGRPQAAWKDAGYLFAADIKRYLDSVSYRGRKSLRNEDSAPIIVATEAIKWAYKRRLAPAGFVSAFRGRSRTKIPRSNRILDI